MVVGGPRRSAPYENHEKTKQQLSVFFFANIKDILINNIIDNHSTKFSCQFVNMDLSQLTPQQKQAVLIRAQQEANQQIYQKMMADMLENCFQKCTGTSVSFVSLPF